ncbi:4'-phosphopantetheinyl transferase EntD [Shimia isoporae]|uniref:Enterobactin synthase component D n=1 Tax=Shimia isoporae TaxID=647720 RepID=A0A4R1N7F8_9RHOB|nr:4'-phosphopantetheinyl transferase superfamily protein [Shimia isoporae]TCL00727.1 4'-phosphopantetheinyl transferase EntD [Shimia isoporae]
MTGSSNELNALRDLALRFAPRGVGVGVADPTAGPATVLPEEAVAIASAIPKRKREFAAGRRAARAALQSIDLPAVAIPKGTDRTPTFPSGVAGSITHNRKAALSIVAPETRFRTLGVDIEPEAPLKPELLKAICTQQDRDMLDALPATDRLLLARCLFSAKEAVFKAQYPITRQVFGFDAASITFNSLRTGFTATFHRDIASIRAGSTVSGQCGAAGGHILTMVTLGAVQGTENVNFPVCATG